jgi:EpsI family protein
MKNKIDKTYIVIVVALVGAIIVSWGMYFKVYQQADQINIHHFPKTIDGWNSRELLITDDEYAILETRNAFVREYTNQDGRSVRLFIVYSESNRKVSHPPEICYVGGGVTVLSKTEVFANNPDLGYLLKANKLHLEQGSTEQVAFYWFKAGETYTASYWKQQILIAIKTLFGVPSNSAMIRVSTVIVDEDRASAEQLVKDFNTFIIPNLQKYLP